MITLTEGEQRQLDVVLAATPIANATLFGYVTDAETSVPIVGALVQLSGGYQTSTNNDGYYQLEVPPGAYDGLVTADGYEPLTF